MTPASSQSAQLRDHRLLAAGSRFCWGRTLLAVLVADAVQGFAASLLLLRDRADSYVCSSCRIAFHGARGGLRSGVDSSCLLGGRRRVGCYRSRARVCPCASHVRDECAGGVLVWVRVCVWCVRRVPTPRAIPILRSSREK